MNNSNRTYSGDIDLSSNFTLFQSRPLDDRLSLKTQAALFDTTTWTIGNNNILTRYSGLVTAVVNDSTSANNGVYWLPKSAKFDKQSWDSSNNTTYDINGWRKLLDNTSGTTLQNVNIDYSLNQHPGPWGEISNGTLGIHLDSGNTFCVEYGSYSYGIYGPYAVSNTVGNKLTIGDHLKFTRDLINSGVSSIINRIEAEYISNIQVIDGSDLEADMTSHGYQLPGVTIDQSAMYMLVTSTFGNRHAYIIPAWSSDSGSYSGATTLNQLTDVTLSGSQSGDVLTYNGSVWVNQSITIPTNISFFNNDAGYITANDIPAQVNADWDATGGPAEILNKPTLFSGNYNDLTNTPTIPTVPTNVSVFTNDAGYLTSQVQSDWSETNQSSPAYILNKPNIPASLSIFKCHYNSSNHSMGTTSTQNIIDACDAGNIVICESNEILYYLSEHLELGNGDADEITFLGFKQGAPQNICWIQYKDGTGWSDGQFNFQSDWNETNQDAHGFIKNKPSLATVATTGNYNDLNNIPVIHAIPANISAFANDANYITAADVPNQVQSDWDESDQSRPEFIQNKPNLAIVATTGDYYDLLNTPTIPTIPTNVSYFTNDSGYLTQNDLNDLNVFVCNYNIGTGLMDKTAAEIATAHSSGKVVLCRIYEGQNPPNEFMAAHLALGIDPSHIVFTGLRIVDRQITTLSSTSNGWTLTKIPLDDSNTISQLANSEIWSVNTDASSGTGITISVGGRTKCILFDQTNNRDTIAITFSPETGYYIDFVWSPNDSPTLYPIIPANKCTLLKTRFINSNTLYYELIEMNAAHQ